MTATVDIGRRDLLADLCSRHDALVVWKHLDRALRGRGDIDAAAPADATPAIVADAVRLAPRLLAASHVIRCGHVADKDLLFFVRPQQLPQLFELDLCTQPSRGLAPWAEPRALCRLTADRPDGIRALRPGAEAVVSLVYHGLSHNGRARLHGDERVIVEHGLRTDLDGAVWASALLPPRPARRAVRAVVRTVAGGGWDSRQARQAWAGFLAAGAVSPRFVARRTAFRARLATDRDCVMSRLARRNGRRVPEAGLTALLTAADREGHEIAAL